MALMLDKIHEYTRRPGTSVPVLTKIRPALRLCSQGSPPLWVQEGHIYAEGGPEIEDPPSWFWEEARKTSKMARDECGLILPEEKETNVVVAPFAPQPESDPSPPVVQRETRVWVCDKCGKSMDTGKKGLHISWHKKEEKKAAQWRPEI